MDADILLYVNITSCNFHFCYSLSPNIFLLLCNKFYDCKRLFSFRNVKWDSKNIFLYATKPLTFIVFHLLHLNCFLEFTINFTLFSGVRPYKCSLCEKSFTQRCSLESHCLKVHGVQHQYTYKERRTKVYVCEECGHTTSQPEIHYLHLKDKHPYSPALLKFYDKRHFKFTSSTYIGCTWSSKKTITFRTDYYLLNRKKVLAIQFSSNWIN